MIKAVLFDLDGVLVDACDWHYNALNQALVHFGEKEISREDHETKFNGLPTEEKLIKLGIESFRRSEIKTLKQEITTGYILECCKPDQSKIYLLKKLHADGIKVGVVTNCSEDTARLMLNKLGLATEFEILVHNKSTQYPKPNPDPYFYAMARLGVKPTECLIVEDSPKGLESARLSGGNIYGAANSKDVTAELMLPCIEALNNALGKYS